MRGSRPFFRGGVWRIFEFSRGDPPPPSIPPPFPNKHPRKHSHEYLFLGGGDSGNILSIRSSPKLPHAQTGSPTKEN